MEETLNFQRPCAQGLVHQREREGFQTGGSSPLGCPPPVDKGVLKSIQTKQAGAHRGRSQAVFSCPWLGPLVRGRDVHWGALACPAVTAGTKDKTQLLPRGPRPRIPAREEDTFTWKGS